MAGEEESLSLEHTSTWIVAVLCFIIVLISLVAERGLHRLGKFFRDKSQDALYETLQKLKEELMILGFISLLLTVTQGLIRKICVPESITTVMLPCKLKESSASNHLIVRTGRHLLAGGNGADHCSRHEGKVPLIWLEALHQVHIFIFVLAVTRVIFCATTMVLGGLKIRQWRHWEHSIQRESRPHHVHLLHLKSFLDRAGRRWRKHCVISWTVAFFKQFYGSVTKSDYIVLRSGFIKEHCPANPKFNFHKYVLRTLEHDFKKIVGISWYLWLFVVLFLLMNIAGWHSYFWLAFLPLFLLLLVGAKLEHIITEFAQEVAERSSVVDETTPIRPSDELFWFHNPTIVLYLIHFILFQNSFEIAFFVWIWSTCGFKSCIMEELGFIIPRLVIAVIVQVLCSYSTLPLYALVTQNGGDSVPRSMEKPRLLEDVSDKAKPCKVTEILEQAQCRMVTMPESSDSNIKVARLLYTNSGVGILALGSNGIQKLWKWARNEQNPSGKATANVVPQHWQPNSGLLMTNDVSGVNLEEAVPCIALSKNDAYVISAAGGKVSLFNMMTFKVMTTFMPPPPASTFLAFYPQDNNIIAIGMEDSTILIYNVRVDEVKSELKGHQKRITGLAFSPNLQILVSSGADAQLCLWSIDTWDKRKSVPIQLPAGKAPSGDTRVQFHFDHVHLLVSHETLLAIYDASKMERIRQWVPQDELSAPITYATYSCNSQLVYTSFFDGNIGVFDADTLRLICRIAPSAYLSQAVLTESRAVYPLVVAAHPLEVNQFAVGLNDGSVKVIEPLESNGKWGAPMPVQLSNQKSEDSESNCHHIS